MLLFNFRMSFVRVPKSKVYVARKILHQVLLEEHTCVSSARDYRGVWWVDDDVDVDDDMLMTGPIPPAADERRGSWKYS